MPELVPNNTWSFADEMDFLAYMKPTVIAKELPQQCQETTIEPAMVAAMGEEGEEDDYNKYSGIPAKEENPVTSRYYKNVKEPKGNDKQDAISRTNPVPDKSAGKRGKRSNIDTTAACRPESWTRRMTEALGSLGLSAILA